ncbi:MAG: GNAT family N-acetyltransferase [Novosphingobium sp.]
MAEASPDLFQETERLVLRRERAGDRAEWAARINTPEVMARMGGPLSPEALAESFDRMATAELPYLLLERRTERDLIGKCGLSRIITPHAPPALSGQVQVGWTLRADCWGQGLATEAARVMLNHAFARLNCDAVFSQTSESNRRSWGLMQRLGMRRASELQYPDPDYPPEDNPTIVFVIEKQEWLSING